ncbi:MAG: protein kinase, partial [Gemmatimonadota bacterium]|nr:protein kinase [Gemmatimonadota bacterium]
QDQVDHRSDIYAVGVLAYEMLTGDPPFKGTPRQVLVAQVINPPTPINEIAPSVPPQLAAIIMRCLAKEPGDRYQTTRELLDDIEGLALTDSHTLAGTPGVRRRMSGRAPWAVAGMAVALLGAWLLFSGESANPVVAGGDRIVVVPFENRTGDPALDEAGYMLAEWVTQGLHREEIGNAMPAASVVRMLAALGDGGGDPVGALADAAGANIAVSGAIRMQGDTVIVSSEIVDAQTGSVIGVTEQVRSTDLSQAISVTTQRIQGLLATHFNFGETFFTMSPPPNMEVYHELLAGREAFYRGNFAEATARFERITELAPDYLSHVAGAAAVKFWTGDYAGAESALLSALADPGRLTSNERLGVEYMLAVVQGDLEAAYRTAAAQGGNDPFRLYSHALAALRTNRAHQALAVLEAVDFDSPLAQLNAPLWGIAPVAHHMLGDYPENLTAARGALARYPADLGVLNLAIAPAAAMGDTVLLDSLLSEALDMTGAYEMPPTDTPGWSILLAGLELSAHGHEQAGADMLARSVAWYDGELSRSPDSPALPFASAMARYYGGDLDVLPLFQAWSQGAPDNVDYMGFVGVLSARRGDEVGAASVDARLAALEDAYRFGQHTRWRARIAALRNDLDQSMALLEESFSQGISLHFGQDRSWLHIDPDLAALRDLESFRAFIAPR